ncbi:alpha/beta-hydrolase [Astrocystis sublimbata]|nr:alpha/beta-hydrolase [Astrocystis sublimbata]
MAGDIEESVVAGDGSTTTEEVKPYKIHVSSRYLNLTRQKLEIARLPHEFDEPKSKDWWQPKSQVEPLIDFWLEQYNWRDQEEILNALPQSRTAFTIAQSESPIRLHFIHVPSPRANAIPLLLIPPFPFSSLSVGHLVKLFTEPEEANHQPFHLVIPSLPGLGFSDALPTNSPVISSTAELLDALMKRLGYPHYLLTNAGAGSLSPAQIDYKLADWLATRYSDSCLGTHLISPPLARPRAREAPLGWAKWSVARFFEASILGYRTEDYKALRRSGISPRKTATSSTTAPKCARSGMGLAEPNTLSYALCDSPTGLLVFAMKGLRLLAPRKEFSPTEIINFTQLAWLPGPEAALRIWAHCVQHPEHSVDGKKQRRSHGKPRVALTVFLGDHEKGAGGTSSGSGEGPVEVGFDGPKPAYSCPAWAATSYDVLHVHRVSGDASLLAWERPELIAAGVRELAAAVLRVNRQLQPAGRAETAHAAVVSEAGPGAQEQEPGQTSSEQPRLEQGLLAPPSQPMRKSSDDATKVASNDTLATGDKIASSLPATPSPIAV